jgi:hypothetical protein
MRIEVNRYGNMILCGYILPNNKISVGTRWQGSCGHIVTVESVDGEWIKYSWKKGDETIFHEKLIFAFQCRYCLIVE